MKISFNIENKTISLDNTVYTNWEEIPSEVKSRIPTRFYLSILTFLTEIASDMIIGLAIGCGLYNQ